jgi:hypothetical protein
MKATQAELVALLGMPLVLESRFPGVLVANGFQLPSPASSTAAAPSIDSATEAKPTAASVNLASVGKPLAPANHTASTASPVSSISAYALDALSWGPGPVLRPGRYIVVTNLPPTVSAADVAAHFGRGIDKVACKIPLTEKGEPKGHAFLAFSVEHVAEIVCVNTACVNTVIQGCPVKCTMLTDADKSYKQEFLSLIRSEGRSLELGSFDENFVPDRFVLVTNLPPSATPESFMKYYDSSHLSGIGDRHHYLFGGYKVVMDEMGMCTGSAYLSFFSPDDARSCCNTRLIDSTFGGCLLRARQVSRNEFVAAVGEAAISNLGPVAEWGWLRGEYRELTTGSENSDEKRARIQARMLELVPQLMAPESVALALAPDTPVLTDGAKAEEVRAFLAAFCRHVDALSEPIELLVVKLRELQKLNEGGESEEAYEAKQSALIAALPRLVQTVPPPLILASLATETLSRLEAIVWPRLDQAGSDLVKNTKIQLAGYGNASRHIERISTLQGLMAAATVHRAACKVERSRLLPLEKPSEVPGGAELQGLKKKAIEIAYQEQAMMSFQVRAAEEIRLLYMRPLEAPVASRGLREELEDELVGQPLATAFMTAEQKRDLENKKARIAWELRQFYGDLAEMDAALPNPSDTPAATSPPVSAPVAAPSSGGGTGPAPTQPPAKLGTRDRLRAKLESKATLSKGQGAVAPTSAPAPTPAPPQPGEAPARDEESGDDGDFALTALPSSGGGGGGKKKSQGKEALSLECGLPGWSRALYFGSAFEVSALVYTL